MPRLCASRLLLIAFLLFCILSDLLAENKELSVKLQQHAEFWIKLYPVEKKELKKDSKKAAH